MSDPAFRPVARAPRGFQDRRARELRAERTILSAVAEVYERYGFEALETSAFEYADALGKFLPDSDRPNEGVFSLQDDPDSEGNGQWMALRYDLTAPLARFVAQNRGSLPKPFRRYAFGSVWRNEKPGPGRFREFIQCDADTVGSARSEADAEVIAMAVQGLEAAGLARGAAAVRINNRKLLDGLFQEAGVVDERQRLTALRAIDKYDRLRWAGVRDLLGPGRLDESGDYTRGAELPVAAVSAVELFLGCAGGPETTRVGVLDVLAGLPLGSQGEQGLREIAAVGEALGRMDVGEDQARFDTTVVRGLEYYTGPVFEADLLLATADERGQPVRFGSIGGGGRYDDLVARFTGESTPAVGFSFGVSRLAAALRAAGREPGGGARGPVVVIALSAERMGEYLALADALRRADPPIAAEVYLGSSGMKAQMKYADRRLAPAAVILGDDELAAGTVTVKDLDLGRTLAGEVADNKAWKSERPGQATIPRADLVPHLRRILEAL